MTPSDSAPRGAGPRRDQWAAQVHKGLRAEVRAQQELEAEGWLVHRVFYYRDRRGRWWQNDVFGFADLVARKPGHRVRWIQVTDGGSVEARRRRAPDPWDPAWGRLEIWCAAGDAFDVDLGDDQDLELVDIAQALRELVGGCRND